MFDPGRNFQRVTGTCCVGTAADQTIEWDESGYGQCAFGEGHDDLGTYNKNQLFWQENQFSRHLRSIRCVAAARGCVRQSAFWWLPKDEQFVWPGREGTTQTVIVWLACWPSGVHNLTLWVRLFSPDSATADQTVTVWSTLCLAFFTLLFVNMVSLLWHSF